MTQGQVFTSDPAKVVWGHRGHQQVFADNLRLRERLKWSQCVCLVNTLRLICNLGHAVTLTWGQILPWPFKVMLYIFRCVLTRQTRWCQNHCSIISNTEVINEKLFRSKMPFLTFRDLWRLNGWSQVKSDVTSAKERFKSYLLLFFIWSSYYSSRDNSRHSW